MGCLLEQMGLPWGPSEPGIADILSPSESTFLSLWPLQRTLDKASLQNLDSPTHSQLLISVTHNREDNFDLGGGIASQPEICLGGFQVTGTVGIGTQGA